MSDGAIYTGAGGRIVGPDYAAQKLHDTINDPELRIAFSDEVAAGAAKVLTRASMSAVDIDFPVLVLPESARETFASLPPNPALPYFVVDEIFEGPFPGEPAAGTMTSFGIVRPGSGETDHIDENRE